MDKASSPRTGLGVDVASLALGTADIGGRGQGHIVSPAHPSALTSHVSPRSEHQTRCWAHCLALVKNPCTLPPGWYASLPAYVLLLTPPHLLLQPGPGDTESQLCQEGSGCKQPILS